MAAPREGWACDLGWQRRGWTRHPPNILRDHNPSVPAIENHMVKNRFFVPYLNDQFHLREEPILVAPVPIVAQESRNKNGAPANLATKKGLLAKLGSVGEGGFGRNGNATWPSYMRLPKRRMSRSRIAFSHLFLGSPKNCAVRDSAVGLMQKTASAPSDTESISALPSIAPNK